MKPAALFIICFHSTSNGSFYISESLWTDTGVHDPVCHQFKLLPNHTKLNDKVAKVEPMIENIPRHTLVKRNGKARLNCSCYPGSDHRIQWWVSINNTPPSLISDGDILLNHLNRPRYEIEQPDLDTYNLVIQDVQILDAGTYVCYDRTMGGSPRMVNDPQEDLKLKDNVGEAKAELIVIGTYNVLTLLTWVKQSVDHR